MTRTGIANRLVSMPTAFFMFAMVGACSNTERPAATPPNRSAVRTHTAVAALTTVMEFLPSPGTVRAATTTILSSKITGQILSLKVHVGDRVQRGQVVAEIEGREADAEMRRARAAVVEARHSLKEAEDSIRGAQASASAAEAALAVALATRNRYDILRERHSISPQEYDEADGRYRAATGEADRARQAVSAAEARRLQILSRIEQAEAGMESAAAATENRRITSPIDGIVTARSAEPGTLATPGLPLVTIDDPQTSELEVAVEESRIRSIRPGQHVRVEIDTLEGVVAEGTVREIAAAADPVVRSFTVKLRLPNSGSRVIAPGLFGRAFFPVGERQALLVPASALVRRGQLEGVYMLSGGTAILRLVRTGKIFDQGIEILSGLAPGATFLTAPPLEVFDGARIEALPEAP